MLTKYSSTQNEHCTKSISFHISVYIKTTWDTIKIDSWAHSSMRIISAWVQNLHFLIPGDFYRVVHDPDLMGY